MTLFLLSSANAGDTKKAVAELKAKLLKIGEPKIEGTDKAGDITAPRIYFGTRKINNNFDVVDDIKRSSGASATVFVKDGDEFVRISTNILTAKGGRGTGTKLARNKAYDAILKGELYCGDADILGVVHDTCYDPIKDKSGNIIGIYFVGYKK